MQLTPIEIHRYFIVLDDGWDESPWTLIKCALIKNNFGSRVKIIFLQC
uniref:Uncharacterized protein n=1 Tax=Arundo donax TaxID=35708 RepID=A0A0A8XX47_ARUDO